MANYFTFLFLTVAFGLVCAAPGGFTDMTQDEIKSHGFIDLSEFLVSELGNKRMENDELPDCVLGYKISSVVSGQVQIINGKKFKLVLEIVPELMRGDCPSSVNPAKEKCEIIYAVKPDGDAYGVPEFTCTAA